ncbi:Proton pump-interactor 1 [Raphanus sativus]|uniref:Proton pump-interactor 1 n=1 Tax=Raphanus sativus TaxID=3726 RepID=A0A6J0NGS3_RAPSA|nr:proton pump-interactor 1 [Raphanus sativus]XP_018483947.1 proton pump-interactor 1 [Raphanus sativus]XP_056864817.1 proton pump-interactor 1-like [Raphanus sativus]XP_056864818.1 proton pump-interactor 1-like [Raphanus sativus]KAJ4871086.1 Proton pump-interactor 1 [Raphanus sativus]KAJ4899401.1 Proton pump-interactor 1 [Raphanus sativus]
MGVEVVKSAGGFEVAPAPFEGKPETNGKADKGAAIKFGSNGEQAPKKAEEKKNVLISDVPKDAAEEWPAAKQIRSFYFVKYRHFDDPKIKAKLDVADKELEKLNKARSAVFEQLKAKRAERSELFDLLDPLKTERQGFNTKFDEKRKEMEPLQQALGKLRGNDGGNARGPAICSSEEELNNMIYSYQYRIQHESIPLTEEKQLLKEIRLLEGTRDKVIANEALRAKIKESMGHKDDIQGQVKAMGAGLDGVKKERQAISARINQLSEKVKAAKDEIQVLETELKTVTEKRDKAYSNIRELRKQRDETNSGFYQGRNVLNKARDLAAQKNIEELEALSNAEVEKFISLWCSKKNFREDYEKRLLPSLDARQLSRDGRMRNPEEKPLIAPEAPQSKAAAPSQTEVVPKAKAKQQQPKEEPVSAPKPEATVQKTEKKAKDAAKVKNVVAADEEDDEVYGLGKPQEEKKVDEAALREMRKQEEIAKAKQAMERKKKLTEKAAAKAAKRAQLEAEKKEKKEREKKAKKNGGEAVSEEVPEASEAEKEEIEAPVEEKPQKEKQVRNRIRTRGGPETLPRAILKRKKATNYWIYAAPAALVALMLLFLGYYYVL